MPGLQNVADVPGIAEMVIEDLEDFDKQMLRRVNRFWRDVFAKTHILKEPATVAVPWLSLTTSTAMLDFMTFTEEFSFNIESKSWCSGYHLRKLLSSTFGRNEESITWQKSREKLASIQPNIRACLEYGQPCPENPLDVMSIGKTLCQGTEASFLMTETHDFKTIRLYYSKLSVYYRKFWYPDFEMARILDGLWLPGLSPSNMQLMVTKIDHLFPSERHQRYDASTLYNYMIKRVFRSRGMCDLTHPKFENLSRIFTEIARWWITQADLDANETQESKWCLTCLLETIRDIIWEWQKWSRDQRYVEPQLHAKTESLPKFMNDIVREADLLFTEIRHRKENGMKIPTGVVSSTIRPGLNIGMMHNYDVIDAISPTNADTWIAAARRLKSDILYSPSHSPHHREMVIETDPNILTQRLCVAFGKCFSSLVDDYQTCGIRKETIRKACDFWTRVFEKHRTGSLDVLSSKTCFLKDVLYNPYGMFVFGYDFVWSPVETQAAVFDCWKGAFHATLWTSSTAYMKEVWLAWYRFYNQESESTYQRWTKNVILMKWCDKKKIESSRSHLSQQSIMLDVCMHCNLMAVKFLKSLGFQWVSLEEAEVLCDNPKNIDHSRFSTFMLQLDRWGCPGLQSYIATLETTMF